MALQKDLKTKYGNTASYWKVLETNINWHYKVAHVTLAGFIDKEARIEGRAAIEIYVYDFARESFTFSPDDNVLTIAYNLVKQSEGYDAAFVDAEDI